MTNETQTVRLHRVIRSPAERLYRAFLDPRAMVKWLPPYGFVGEVHEINATVGGSYRMSFTNIASGASQTFGGTYTELTPNACIRHTDSFDDPGLPGEMEVLISFEEVICGTDVTIVQSGIPEAIPVAFCYLGWQESLAQLASLVEPQIPDVPA